MKSDQYGTLAEQKRFAIGYRRPSEIPRAEVETAFQRCRYCAEARARETEPMTNEDTGKRIRLQIAGENYYLIAVRCEDGGMDYLITVPDENRPTGQRQRETAERICAACSELSRMI